MKKVVNIVLFLFGCWGISGAQTIVSTSPQNKKAVLEEYGGIYCVYCPEGNVIAESILADYPDQVMRINIQEGLYANPEPGDPDFRSDYGLSYANQTGLAGYPAGTVNRQVFPGWEQGNPGTTALGRSFWPLAVEEVLGQSATVNVAAEATVDYETNEIEILVEFYYTGNVNATNFLNVAVLQNRVYGPQMGGNEGVNYEHNHLLRDMITGQWGDPIYVLGQGHFEARTYNYQLPAEYRNVPFDSPNMELVIFITEASHQQILNGISVFPDFTVQNAHDANALLLPSPEIICGDYISPKFTFRNDGNQPLTALEIEYRINEGQTHVYNWSGYLNTFDTEEMTLPGINFNGIIGEDNYIHVSVHQPNDQGDEDYDNNEISTAFQMAPPSASEVVFLELKTDAFGFDIFWEITDENGSVIATGGNENVGENGGGTQTGSPSDPGAYGDNQTISEQIQLPGEGCFNFRILDDYGDGLCCQYGYGFYYLQDADGNIIFTGGEFGIEKNEPFAFGEPVTAVDNPLTEEDLLIYPNPVTAGDLLYFEFLGSNRELTSFELVSADQRIRIMSEEVTVQNELYQGAFVTSNLPSGVYFLKVQSPQGILTRKVILLR